MAYADWSDEDYQDFHDLAFSEVYDPLIAQLEEIGAVYDPSTLDTAEELFEQGWLNMEISEEERETFRGDFYDLMNIGPEDFDWEDFREVYDEING